MRSVDPDLPCRQATSRPAMMEASRMVLGGWTGRMMRRYAAVTDQTRAAAEAVCWERNGVGERVSIHLSLRA
jgi:hypothetical protein